MRRRCYFLFCLLTSRMTQAVAGGRNLWDQGVVLTRISCMLYVLVTLAAAMDQRKKHPDHVT